MFQDKAKHQPSNSSSIFKLIKDTTSEGETRSLWFGFSGKHGGYSREHEFYSRSRNVKLETSRWLCRLSEKDEQQNIFWIEKSPGVKMRDKKFQVDGIWWCRKDYSKIRGVKLERSFSEIHPINTSGPGTGPAKSTLLWRFACQGWVSRLPVSRGTPQNGFGLTLELEIWLGSRVDFLSEE